MDSTKWISKKVALLGNHGVGKTSLISRFVLQKFPENYLTTIGLKVNKKTVELDDYRVELLIWDIAGEEDFSKVPQYYLNGCSGVVYVVDLSRPITYANLPQQLKTLKQVVNTDEIVLAANKVDLYDPETELGSILEEFEIQPDIITSAKTGEQVDDMFMLLAKKLIQQHESQGA